MENLPGDLTAAGDLLEVVMGELDGMEDNLVQRMREEFDASISASGEGNR